MDIIVISHKTSSLGGLASNINSEIEQSIAISIWCEGVDHQRINLIIP